MVIVTSVVALVTAEICVPRRSVVLAPVHATNVNDVPGCCWVKR
jgi:hypothetical protein